MKRLLLSIVALMVVQLVVAASKQEPKMSWYNPHAQQEFVVHGQAWSEELRGKFWRFPERTKEDQRKAVWGLSTHSAGVHLRFKTNTREVKVRYTPSRVKMDHFPATGLAGMDLYARNSKGEWRYCSGRHTRITTKDTVVYTFRISTPKDWRDADTEFYLYLPLYADTKWCEVGVTEGSSFKFTPKGNEKPIVMFGCSVDQGACASRPGMAWTYIASRNINRTILNYGFSGNGRFEASVVNLVREIDAEIFIFGCLGNMGLLGDEGIRKNILEGVKALREKSNAPILFLENFTATEEHARTDTRHTSDLLKKVYKEMCDAGVKNLYYLTTEEINLPQEGTVDGSHPNDYGMKVIGDAIGAKLNSILAEIK